VIRLAPFSWRGLNVNKPPGSTFIAWFHCPDCFCPIIGPAIRCRLDWYCEIERKRSDCSDLLLRRCDHCSIVRRGGEKKSNPCRLAWGPHQVAVLESEPLVSPPTPRLRCISLQLNPQDSSAIGRLPSSTANASSPSQPLQDNNKASHRPVAGRQRTDRTFCPADSVVAHSSFLQALLPPPSRPRRVCSSRSPPLQELQETAACFLLAPAASTGI